MCPGCKARRRPDTIPYIDVALDITHSSTLRSWVKFYCDHPIASAGLFPAEPRASDLQLDATGTWNYAIDPSTLKFVSEESASDLPSPIFDSNVPPVYITVQACPIEWETAGDTFAAPPPENPECIGDAVDLKLQPYGVSSIYSRV